MYKKVFILFMSISIYSCNTSKSESDKKIASNHLESSVLTSAKDFDSLIKNKKDIVIIDVRTPEEYSKGHINNALNLDWKGTEFNEQLNAIDKKQTLLVYCLSGGRSRQAISFLRQNGYNNIVELDGGIMSWRASNLPEISIVRNNEGMTLEAYNKLLDSDKLVLVDFNATWCAPCKKMKPILEKIEKDFSNKVKIIKIDVDQNSSLIKELGVSGLPVLKLYLNKEILWEHKGFADEKMIISNF